MIFISNSVKKDLYNLNRHKRRWIIPEPVDRIEKITHLIEIQKQRTTQVLIDAELDKTYPDAEIDLDDRPISVILAEERAMKKILADERAYLKQVIAPKQ